MTFLSKKKPCAPRAHTNRAKRQNYIATSESRHSSWITTGHRNLEAGPDLSNPRLGRRGGHN